MLKKLVSSAVLAVMFLAAASMFKPVHAAENASVYIVLRCTVTLSVSLTGTPTSFVLGDVSAGTTVYSTSGIDLRNDSQGAICSWDLNIDNLSLNSWTLADKPGLDQVAIYGVFQKTEDAANFDIVNDTFSTTARQYITGGAYECGSYVAEGHGQEHRILPYNYMPSKADRKLWIKMLTPLAVTDTLNRTIILVVTAKMAG